jgi:pyruvate/2-oxoglutarate dehydrogenase complex dihydrolipoamide acyltransferase (E2) component
MFVELGNDKPIEGYREEGSDEVKYRAVDGETQQITHYHFPEGHSIRQAFNDVLNSIHAHFAHNDETNKPHAPIWVHSDSQGLKALLEEEFGIREQKPEKWGRFESKDETPGVVLANGFPEGKEEAPAEDKPQPQQLVPEEAAAAAKEAEKPAEAAPAPAAPAPTPAPEAQAQPAATPAQDQAASPAPAQSA